ncbi:uncharacterized protein EI97DRAFT_489205, partial [Westerdykella ornata]
QTRSRTLKLHRPYKFSLPHLSYFPFHFSSILPFDSSRYHPHGAGIVYPPDIPPSSSHHIPPSTNRHLVTMPASIPYAEPRITIHETWVPHFIIHIESVPIPVGLEEVTNPQTGRSYTRPNRWIWVRRTIPIRVTDDINFQPQLRRPILLPREATFTYPAPRPDVRPIEFTFYTDWTYIYPDIPYPGRTEYFYPDGDPSNFSPPTEGVEDVPMEDPPVVLNIWKLN